MTLSSLKLLDWPEADRKLWEQLTRTGSVLDDVGAGANWATETRRVTARDYGYWLTFVLAVDGLVHEPPAKRVTRDRVVAFCERMQDSAARTKASRIARLHALMRGAEPAVDWRWLAEIRRALERAARRQGPVRHKQGRILPSGRLLEGGLSLARDAHLDTDLTVERRAARFRDGLIIALLAARPLRIKNFATLRLGLHLQATASGYLINIPGSECKTGRPIETFVPDELCPWLSLYLEVYRPQLLDGLESDYLWVHKRGVAYKGNALALRIGILTKRLFGVRIGPHLFRDCAATTIATDSPEHVLSIAPLLGHATLKTAERHYNHASALDAGRRFQNSIKRLRRHAWPLKRSL
jgi:integrase